MKIIILGNWRGLKTRPDKLDYLFFSFLKNNSIYDIILCENNEIKFNENIESDDIIIVFSVSPSFIKNFKNKKIFYIYDLVCNCEYGCNGDSIMCGFQNQLKYIYEHKFDYIWYKYETPITIKLSNFNNNYYKFSHMVFDKNIHKDYNLEKKYDILFYGAIFPQFYPFRNRLYHLLKKNTDKFNIKFLPYTKKCPEKMTVGEDLYKLIGECWLTTACCAISNCLLAKYFEIGLCGSVVLGDYPEYESEKYLKENMIYINNDMSDEDIINNITKALDNKKKLQEYSENTKNYILNNYMYENGLKRFEELISKCM